MLSRLYTIEEGSCCKQKQQSTTPSLLGCFGGIDVAVEQCTHEHNVTKDRMGSYGRLKHASEQEGGSGIKGFNLLKAKRLYVKDQHIKLNSSSYGAHTPSSMYAYGAHTNSSGPYGAHGKSSGAHTNSSMFSSGAHTDYSMSCGTPKSITSPSCDTPISIISPQCGTFPPYSGTQKSFTSHEKKLGRMGVVKSKLKSSTHAVASKLKKACVHIKDMAHKSSPHMLDLFLSNHLLGQLSSVPSPFLYHRSSSLPHYSPPNTSPFYSYP